MQNLTRRPSPRFAYSTIAGEVLPGWDISLVFVGPTKARELNMQLRKKEYIPNVLSYVAGEKSGEIIICLSEAAKQAPSFSLRPNAYCLLLFIHGLLHIKGWAHSAKMEKCEQTLLAKYEAPYSNRNRHRDLPSKGSGGRRTLR